jgi:antitoxin ParD1/3/4
MPIGHIKSIRKSYLDCLLIKKALPYLQMRAVAAFTVIPIIGTLQIKPMSKNTSISLGNYFEDFVNQQITSGRYKNVSEVIRAGLRLLEDEENKTIVLKKAIQEGLDSGIAEDFDPLEQLKELKYQRNGNG